MTNNHIGSNFDDFLKEEGIITMTDKQIIIDKLKNDVACKENIINHLAEHNIKLQDQLKRKEQKLKKIEEFRHNYCMGCEDLLKPSHSCKGCNMVELKRLIEGRDNG